MPYAGGPEVILTCGSTDGFSKCLELFSDTWCEARDDPAARPGLLVETFMYGSVLSQALPRGFHAVPVEMDGDGMLAAGPGGLEEVLAGWDEAKGKRPHLMYTVTFVKPLTPHPPHFSQSPLAVPQRCHGSGAVMS